MAVTIDGTNGINDTVLGSSTPAAANVTTLGASGEVTATGFTGTLDGILGSGTPAAATVTTFTSNGIDDNADAVAITIDSSENVGIGTASPATLLEIASPASTATVFRLASNKTGSGAGDRCRWDNYSANNSGVAYQLGFIDFDRSDATATASYMAIQTRVGGTVAERMRIDSAGKVGIGTASPGFKVEVVGGTNDGIHIKDAASATVFGGLFTQSAALALVTRSNHALAFGSNDITRMTITNAGNVGIGTAAPASLLDVNGQIASRNTGAAINTAPGGFGTFIQTTSSGQCAIMSYSSGGGTTLSLHSNAGGAAVVENIRMTPTVVTVNESSLDMDFRVESNGNANMLFVDGGNDRVGIGIAAPAGILNVSGTAGNGMPATSGSTQSAGLITRLQQGGGIGSVMDIGGNGGSGSWIQVTESGNLATNYKLLLNPNGGGVLVGTTGTASFPHTGSLFVGDGGVTNCIQTYRNSTGGAGHVGFNNPNGRVGEIYTTGSTTVYNTSSDYRLKENVVYDWDATTRLKQLKPSRFNFIADADTTFDGFLAHEAQAVVPECVTGVKDEVDADGNPILQGIDQSKIVPLLVKTIQELEARITALEG